MEIVADKTITQTEVKQIRGETIHIMVDATAGDVNITIPKTTKAIWFTRVDGTGNTVNISHVDPTYVWSNGLGAGPLVLPINNAAVVKETRRAHLFKHLIPITL